MIWRSARRPRTPDGQDALQRLLRPASGRPEPGALQAAGVRRDLRAHDGAARRPRAARRCSAEAKQLVDRLRAVQGRTCTASAPTCAQPVGQRLPAAAVLAGVVALRRHRRAAARTSAEAGRREPGRAMRRRELIAALRRLRRAARPHARRGPARQDPAHRVPRRRDRLRPGADHQRPLLLDDHRAHLRGAADLRLPGAAGEAAAATAAAMPEVSADGRRFTIRAAAGHLLRRRPGLQGPARASWSPPTTSTRSSASTTRVQLRATCTCSSRSSCPA